jgi:putative PEP-CTERM system TPR-repeat lipoprotein
VLYSNSISKYMARSYAACSSTSVYALNRLACAALVFAGTSFPAHATPQKAAEFYQDALRKLERNESRAAAIQLRNALEEDSRLLAAHVLLAQTLLKSGDIRGAEGAFDVALKHGVDRNAIAVPLAQTYLGLGRPDLVIERISASGLTSSLKAEVLALRGVAYAESGRRSLARQSFEEARSADANSIAPFIAEIGVLLQAREYGRATMLAAKVVQIAPRSADAWNMHASVLHATADLHGALEAYDHAIRIEPRHVDARLAHAAVLIDLKRDTAAESDLNFLKDSAPGEPRAAYMRAVLASRKGDERAVLDSLQEVAKFIDALAPRWLASREQLLMLGALANHALGNLEKARSYLDHVLIRNGRHLGAKKLFASICIDLKDYSRARTELELLYKALPDDPQVLYMLGTVHLVQGSYLKATQLLDASARRASTADVNRALGFSLLELGRTELGRATLEKVLDADAADTQTAMRLALLYFREGQPRKALGLAEATLARVPANLTMLNFVGIVKAALGDSTGARAAYAQVLRADPSFRPAALNLAKLDVSEGRLEDGRRRLTTLLTAEQESSEVLLELGLLEQRAGNVTDAVRHLRRAVDSQRRDPRPGLVLIELYLWQHQFDKALSTANQLFGKFPKHMAVRLALGSAHLAGGDVASARAVYQEAAHNAGLDADMRLHIARLQLAAGSADAAYQSAQSAMQARPDDLPALVLLVEIERQRGGAAKAEAALKALALKHPNAVEAVVARGDLALTLNQHAAAVSAYRTAFAREETTGNALNVARAYVAGGEGEKAVAFLQQWAAKRPADVLALKGLSEMQLRTGNLPAAAQNYRRALSLEPRDPTTLNNYANVLHMLNDAGAQALAERALELVPGHPDYADTLGWILIKKGQAEAGMRYLKDARLRSPDNGEVRFHLAYALAHASRTDEAREELKAALSAARRPSDSEDFQRLRKRLGL